jgi:hypothetical protein
VQVPYISVSAGCQTVKWRIDSRRTWPEIAPIGTVQAGETGGKSETAFPTLWFQPKEEASSTTRQGDCHGPARGKPLVDNFPISM